MLKTDTLIIGGGITGISAAAFLGKESDYILLEGTDEVGGYCKTVERNGFVWDYSGHFFHFRNPEIRDYVMENMSCEVVEVQKITDIDYKGNIIDFPFQYNIHQLPKNEFIECMCDMYAVGEVDRSSFKSFIKSSLGSAICDKFLIPYNEKLYATDLDNLDADAMGRFFPKSIDFDEMMRRISSENKFVSYNDTFIYPIKGAFEFVKSMLSRVDESRIRKNCKALRIDVENKTVETTDGTIQFNTLISTTPFNMICEMMGKKEDGLSSNKVAVFNLGFDRGSDIKSHWRYFPGNEIFYRIGFYNNILSQGNLSLYVEIGLSSEDDLDKNELLNRVLTDLAACNIVDDHVLVDHEFIVMNPAYVHITKDSDRLYQEWCDAHNPLGIYSIGRYGSWTYCSIEDNIIQARDTCKNIKQHE